MRVRVHLVDLPPLLEDAVRVALESTTTDLVSGPPATTRDGVTTIVVTSQDSASQPHWSRDLLRRRPDVAILAIRPEDTDGTVFELWPERRSLGRLNADRIVRAAADVVPWANRFAEVERDDD